MLSSFPSFILSFFLSFFLFLSFLSLLNCYVIHLLISVLKVYCISVFLCFYVVSGGGDAAR